MRSQITFAELLGDDAIEVGVFDTAPQVERLKAFNHNTGDTLPQREFIASPNKQFKPSIMRQVNGAVDAIKEQSIAEDRAIQEILDDSVVATTVSEQDILDILNGES